MKRVLTISFTILLLAGMFVLLGFIRQEHSNAVCRDIRVTIEYRNSDTLVSSDEIKKLLTTRFDTLEGSTIQASHLAKIRNTITGIHYIENCDVDFLLNGSLRIRARQRVPILRVMTGFQTWFIDEQGIVMPRHPFYSAKVAVASGQFSHTSALKPGNDLQALADTNKVFAAGTLYQMVKLAKYIHKDEILNSLVEQLFVNESGEIELFTYVGSHRVIFGKAENIEHKFNNLINFYRAGPSVTGLDQYKTINLKYHNQVVCSKS